MLVWGYRVRGTYISESVKYHTFVECQWLNSRLEEGKAALEELLRHQKSKGRGTSHLNTPRVMLFSH